jgi:hypothetical protein
MRAPGNGPKPYPRCVKISFLCGVTPLQCITLRSLILLSAIAVPLSVGDTASACDRCRLVQSTAFHEHPIGGDDDGDVRFPPGDYTNPDGSVSFSTTGSQWAQPGACGTNFCKGTPLEITYSYENMFDEALKMPNGQPLPANVIRESIEEALALWASVTPLSFREVEDDGLAYWQGSTKFGQIRFRHILINGPDPVIGDPIAKAQAWFPSGSSDQGGDVEFDHADRWQVVGTLKQPDILGAAIHEIGHALGLNHSLVQQSNQFWSYQRYNSLGQVENYQTPKGNANMFWIFNRFTGPGSGFLFQDDINGIRSIYGAGQGSVLPLNLVIPEPASIALMIFAFFAYPSRCRRTVL